MSVPAEHQPPIKEAQLGNLEDRVARLQQLLARADADSLNVYHDRMYMSWIYHDNALEGTIYSVHEMQAAIHDQVVSDAALIPVYDEIRQHKQAIDIVRELNEKKRSNITLETIKKLYIALAPDEVEGKNPPKYRKDMPMHRLYFHEISTPDKISYKLRQLMDWINSSETKRSTHPARLAAKAHTALLQIYPYPKHNGKLARLLMNLILLRSGYPPAIIHSTERQRYYDALKHSSNAVSNLVLESLLSSVESGIRYFESQMVEIPPPVIQPVVRPSKRAKSA